MFRTLVKQIRHLFKIFTKCSLWSKVAAITLTILIICVIVNTNKPKKEGFVQEKKFEMRQGPDIYDDFYAEMSTKN